MSNRSFFGLLIVLSFSTTLVAEEGAFRFLATGDVPYSQEQEADYRRFLKQSEAENFQFMVHVGDIKSGGSPCTDESFVKIRDLFRAYPKPVVYTPGDNEWTDCHGTGSDPIERLKKLRELFFKDPATLRLSKLGAIQQSRSKQYLRYVENYRFSRSGVLFIVVHVVGSGNNRRADDPPSLKEFTERDQANTAFLKESFAEAIKKDVPGVAVIFHANPDFENVAGEGFKSFIATMREFLSKYHKPVIGLHGDSHYFRIDKPLKSELIKVKDTDKQEGGKTLLHFSRVEVFGSPVVAGLAITVNPKDPQVFTVRPYFLKDKKNDK